MAGDWPAAYLDLVNSLSCGGLLPRRLNGACVNAQTPVETGTKRASDMKLYKYRDFSDPSEDDFRRLEDLVQRRRIWCARPDTLNDPEEFLWKCEYTPTGDTLELLTQLLVSVRGRTHADARRVAEIKDSGRAVGGTVEIGNNRHDGSVSKRSWPFLLRKHAQQWDSLAAIWRARRRRLRRIRGACGHAWYTATPCSLHRRETNPH